MTRRWNELSRRDFLVRSAVALGGATATPLMRAVPENQQRKVLHIIGHSHIDAAWLWPWRDGEDAALTTFRSALNRMDETPGFCYTHSSSAHYRWVERADPGLFAEVKQRIREGRWEVVGGWPVEPDCNIPATESFVRHCLYGKEYCQRELGVDVKIGFNPDSFGHAAGLPTILKHAGYGYYVFMRPQEHEMKLPLLFWWEGPDGSRVLVSRIWYGYDLSARKISPAATAAFAPGFNHGAFFLGVGDHGGAVTKEQLREILELSKDSNLPELRFSTMRRFFSEVESSPVFSTLPVVKGELQHHSRGCYSANGEVKFLNRRAERSLVQCETISVAAHLSAGHPYPGKEFAESWWKVLFCQFHDMMAGTSLYSDYQDVRDSDGYACEVAQTTKVEALETMAKRVDLSHVEEGAVFLFNPLPWRRKALVEYYTDKDPSGKAPVTHLASKDGIKVPVQWRPSASMTSMWFPRIHTWVELPPCGYKVFELAHGEPPEAQPFKDFVTVSQTGFGISSLKAADGTELLAAPIGLVAISDTSDTWAHGIDQFRQEMGRPTLISSAVVEDGPLLRITRHRARWQNSDIVLNISQFAGMDFVELHFVIDWREHEQILKLEIPTALASPRVFAKVPGEVLERGVNGEEEPYQDWIGVQGRLNNADYTVGLVNDSTYSYDCLNGLLRTILIRSAPFARHNPNQVPYNDDNAWQDQGRQERRFWLMCGRGSYRELALDRRAEELQTPAEYVMDSAHPGTEVLEQSFFEVMPANVWVLAVKRAELQADQKANSVSTETIVRVQERSGTRTTATIKSSVLGLNQTVDLAPWELKTVLIHKSGNGPASISEVSVLET